MVSSVSGASLTSAAGIEQLVKLSTSREQKSVTDLQTQIEDIEVKRGIYTDVQSKLEAIRTALSDLRGSDGDGGSFNTFKASVSGEEGVVSTSVSSSTSASPGSYDVKVSQLAQVDRWASYRFDETDTNLGLTGTLSINSQDITVDGLSLEEIRNAINDTAFDDGSEVTATIVDNRLVLTGQNTGSAAALTITETIAGSVDITDASTVTSAVSGLGFDGNISIDQDGDGNNDTYHLQTAQDASAMINGITVSRSTNTFDDVIDGVTLTLSAVSQESTGSTVTIAKDNSDIKAKLNALLEAVNGAVKHLKLKTEPQLDDTVDGDNPTYKAAPLGSDYGMRELRYGLTSDILSFFSGAASGGYDSLMDLGVDVGDDNVSLKLTDADALTNALDDNFAGVLALFDHVADKLDTRLDRYIDDSSSIISRTQDSLDDQIESTEDRKDSAKERLTRMEEMYRNQFYQMQATLLTMQYDYQNTMSLMYGSQSLFSQQG